MNKEDSEVYFLGKNKPEQHKKRIYIYTIILLAILGISGWIYYKSTIKKQIIQKYYKPYLSIPKRQYSNVLVLIKIKTLQPFIHGSPKI